MDTADSGIELYPDDTVTIDGHTYDMHHTPERAVISEILREQGSTFTLADPRDLTYRRPNDTLDDRL